MSDFSFRSHLFIFLIAVFVVLAFALKSRERFSEFLKTNLFYIIVFASGSLAAFDLLAGTGVTGRLYSKVIIAANYFWVGLIGLCVGGVELIARYRDNPWGAIRTFPAVLYMLINVSACMFILYILDIVQPGWLFTSTSPSAALKNNLYLVLTAGFGAVALFRSSIFKIKTNDGELSIGPAVILDTILSASDRAVDRIVAGPRGVSVAEIMKDVSFERAKTALPSYCFALMQNVSQQEQKEIGDQVNKLSASTMDDKVRSLNLGLALINLVGTDVLKSAVSNLGAFIQGEPPIEQREVAKIADLVKSINFDAASIALPTYCFSLVPNVSSEAQTSFMSQVKLLAQSQLPSRVKTLILGLGISNLIGFPALKLAIEQLGKDIQ
jgi:hypothetical protein